MPTPPKPLAETAFDCCARPGIATMDHWKGFFDNVRMINRDCDPQESPKVRAVEIGLRGNAIEQWNVIEIISGSA